MNGNFMRPGQHKNNNNNRNRNRNRRHTGGGNSGGGGNSSNKVFDSNGPDVKLRGTTQTIAEKYMQLGRDAQSSGDSVAAENYYQHAEHYYRLWAASQPVGHSLVMSRKLGEEEFDDEATAEGAEEETEAGAVEGVAQAEGVEPGDANAGEPSGQMQGEGQPHRNNRNNRDNSFNNRNNRPRWQNRRNDRGDNVQPANGNVEGGNESQALDAQPATIEAPAAVQSGEAQGQWEAPSFLQRPAPIQSETAVEATDADAPAPRRSRTRKPKTEAADAGLDSSEDNSSAE